MGHANNLIELYGVRRFFADLDAGRDFIEHSEHIVGATLAWAAGEGFAEFFKAKIEDWIWDSALEFRQRYLLKALKKAGGF